MRRVLSHVLVTAPGAGPGSWLFILHGFFGAGRNWTTVARRLSEARPDWGVVLVDLRLHGGSQDFTPPHTVAACAEDLIALAGATRLSVRGVLGHSFGGKVALAYVARRPAQLRQAWIVDVDPSAAEPRGGPWELLRAIRAMPPEYQTRDALVAGLVSAGVDRRTADWMATNLEHAGTAYRWRLDFNALEELLTDFAHVDLWSTIEQLPPRVDLHFIKATRSNALSDGSLARLRALTAGTARVAIHEVEGGHWLNADNPEAVVALLNGSLPECASPSSR